MKSKLLKSILLLMVFSISIQLQAQTQSPRNALSFDGVNDYVSGTGISTALTAITIETWVYHETLPTGVVQRYVTINPEVAVLRYDGSASGGTNELHFYIKNSAGTIISLRVDNVLSTGTWMHVAGTYDGTTMKLYLNGNLIKSGAAVGLYPPSGSFAFSSSTTALNGKMDEVSVWDYARAMTDIREDMYRDAPTANANLINYWQFNNGTGTTLTDMKGTATGTLNNMDDSNWVVSTIPFAAGAVNTQIVNATGTKTFTGTGLVMNFTDKSGTDTIVASRIDTVPNTNPTGVLTVFNSQYWAVKRFGSGTFTSNLTFTLSEDLITADESLPANILLYARADNSDAGWTLLATATSVNAAGNTATFNGITGFSQFIVVRDCNPPAISSQSTATQTQNLGGTFTPITVTATGDNLTYQWYSNASANNSGGTSLSSNNGAQTYSYTPQSTTGGTLYYYCVVSGTCGASQTSAISGAIIVSTVVSGISGTGTTSDPYQIATLDNLNWLQSPDNYLYWQYNFIQTADIEASSTSTWDSGSGFSPIGNYNNRFTGTYNGKGHTIDSLYINRPDSNYVGFIGYAENSTIDSLNLTDVNITGDDNVGALGYLYKSNLSYCSSSGSISGSSSNSQNVGGLVGNALGYYPIGAKVKYCFSSVIVSSPGSYIGALIGAGSTNLNGYIRQCYANGLVSGGTDVGGIIGEHGEGTIRNVVDSSYWDTEATGQISGVGYYYSSNLLNFDATGKSTAEMKTQSTYAGWDFNNVWFISPNVNNGYPCFYYSLVVGTPAVSNIKTFTATGNGQLVRKGTLDILAHGVCWNTTGSPTIANSMVNLGSTSVYGEFTADITGLHHGTTYYVRAYAINERDTVYGEEVNFTTTNVNQAATCLKNRSSSIDVNIPDNNTLDLTNNYTIEAWIKPQVSFGNDQKTLIEKGSDGYYIKTLSTGNHNGFSFDGMTTADNILTLDQWYHIAAVNDNGTRHLYLNGVEQPLSGTAITVVANNNPLYISNHSVGTNKYYRGLIDEVRLWNTALAYSQLRQNMHLPLTGTEPGLVSYWQFDEGSGTSITDKMGINNGTLVDIYGPITSNYFTTSAIPFGDGYSNTQLVSATGTNNFINTGLTMNFTAKTGLDSIVVARIDTFPNINPTGLAAIFDRQYWVVHKYGNGTLTANLTFTIDEDLNTIDENNPSNIKLYTRNTLAEDSSWVSLASASSVNAASNTATFNGITGFSQFIIGKASLTASWAGNNSTDSSESTNWSDGAVPTATCDINIPTGTTFSPIVNVAPATPAVCNNLTIQAGAVLTVAAGKALTVNGILYLKSDATSTASLINDGTLTVVGTTNSERYMTGNKWHLVSPTVSGGSISTFIQAEGNAIPFKDVSGINNYGMMDYNETDNEWNDYFTTVTEDNLISGKGYSMRRTADGIVTFTGVLTSGTKTVPLTKGGDGWNCVGNPYSSAIYMNTAAHAANNFITVNSSNLDASYACVYIWDEDATYTGQNFYKVISNSGFSTSKIILAQNFVAPGQGFFVKAKTGSTTISFTSAMQSQQVSTTFRAPAVKTSWPGIVLNAASADASSSSAIITFNRNMTNRLDVTYDAGLLRGTNGLSLYSRLVEDNGVDFAIQCLPEDYDNLIIPVGVDCKEGGEITFSAQTVDLPATCNVILEDRTANTFTSLEGDATYKTTVTAGTTPVGRFYIHTSVNTTTGTSGLTAKIDSLKAYIANGAIIIVGAVSDQATATLYDLQGRKIWVNSLQKGSLNTLSCSDLMKGMYLLTIQQKDETVTRKLIMK